MFRQLFGGDKSRIPSVNPQEAWKQLSAASSSSMLIDVREPWEYANGHASNAKNIPLSQLQQRVDEVPGDREVLLICQSGHRSMQAAKFLSQHGKTQVVNVTGGTTVWQMHGLPMSPGKSNA
ncbi:MAG TPA: rhodanese-like domain-containing protein [Ktedonobacteraceae bacterium]|nr:rhodanese-like domain-containing protein [Ktedonobacteraceae bacterium]